MTRGTSGGEFDRTARVTLALVAATLALAYGIWYAYSVILVALLEDFGWTRSTVAGAFSLFAVVHGMSNPLVGHLCDRVSPALLTSAGGLLLALALGGNSLVNEPWQLYLSFGGFTAVAVASCGWVPAVVQVQRRFHLRLGLALGIVSSGIGVGMLIVVPACQALIDALGWRWAFRALGLACAAVVIPAGLYLHRHAPEPRRAPEHGGSEATTDASAPTLRAALRTQPFWLMVLAFFCGGLCSQTLHVHQVAFLVDHGVAALTAAGVVGVVGVASVFGKTGGGFLSDRFERELVFFAGILIMVAAVAVLHAAGSRGSAPLAYLFGLMLGVGYSATAALTPAMLNDRFRGPHFGSILGVGLVGSSAGSALGPWQGGYLFDHTGSYALPFGIAAACGLGAGGAALRAWSLRRRSDRRVETAAADR
ncbi:MAG: MFS transporter [Gammaproteobacteria bacterium]